MIEVLKQMVEALIWCHGGESVSTAEAIKAGKQAIAELKKQKPVGEIGWAANVPNTISEVRWVDGCPEIGTKIFTYPPHSDKEEIPKGVKLAISNFGVTLVKTQHGYELRKLGKITPAAQPEPTPWRDIVVVALVREGIDKHRARELADHFAAQRPWQGLTPEEMKHLYPYGRSVWGKETFEAIEKALKDKNT